MIRIARPSFNLAITWAFLLVGALWGGFLGRRQIKGESSVLDAVEYLTLDWRFRAAGARSAPRGVVIAAIDDEAVAKAGVYPLPRSAVAEIVNGLAALKPQAIAVDIAFLDAGDPKADQQLADALRPTKSVLAAIGVFGRGAQPLRRAPSDKLGPVPTPTSVLWPAAPFRAVASTGLANIATDSNGVPRFVPMIYRSGEDAVPSFALAAVSAALGVEPVFGRDTVKIAGRTSELDLRRHLPIRYYGPSGAIRHFSAARILAGDLDPEAVRGQIVVLGATAVGIGDRFGSPFDESLPGVEVLATGVSNLLAGDGLIRTPLVRRIDALTAILAPVLIVALLAMRRIYWGLAGLGLAAVLWLTFTAVAFAEGYWFSTAVPVAAVVPIAAGYGAARLCFDRLASRRLAADKDRLSTFQSPLLIEHILSNPRFLEKPMEQKVAVVFLDLSGFTGLAELVGPQWARDLLSAFQSMVEHEAASREGFVASFMGDGAMIVFGLPAPRPDDASRAFLTVMALYGSTVRWLEGLPPIARQRLDVRISGHFGTAVVSRLGPGRHQHIAATGDTVNVAARLLEVAKEHKRNIVVSEDLARLADPPAIEGTTIEVAIRGRAQPVRVRMMTTSSVA